MEFKAQSISYSSCFTLQKSTKALTIPRAPKLGRENRSISPNENANPNISSNIREPLDASEILETSDNSDENSFEFDFKFY